MQPKWPLNGNVCEYIYGRSKKKRISNIFATYRMPNMHAFVVKYCPNVWVFKKSNNVGLLSNVVKFLFKMSKEKISINSSKLTNLTTWSSRPTFLYSLRFFNFHLQTNFDDNAKLKTKPLVVVAFCLLSYLYIIF